MEDGSDERGTSETETQGTIKNGVVPSIMSTFPENQTHAKENQPNIGEEAKVNGDIENSVCEEEYSSESDALVIDESIPKKPTQKRKRTGRNKGNKKAVKESEVITHSNPFFNESLYELSQQHQSSQPVESLVVAGKKDNTSVIEKPVSVSNCKIHKHKKGKGKSPKREYAQYLGLQPTVQFKCSKCGQAGFETLVSLNEHIVQCDAVPAVIQPPTQDSSSSSFKLTRKVFLCSACGTYYENWNLYLHMLELHRRFICLYCLGMFSAPNDLCHHIQSKHNLQPGHRNSLDEFFNVYNEPCYVVCCECNKLFNEEDNFFYHNCTKSGNSNNKQTQKSTNKTKPTKVPVRPENHVTGDSGHSPVHMQVSSETVASVHPDSEQLNLENDSVQENEEDENKHEDTVEREPEDIVEGEPEDVEKEPENALLEKLNETEDVMKGDNEDTSSDTISITESTEKQVAQEDNEVAMEISNNSFDNLTSGDKLDENFKSSDSVNTEVKSECLSEPQSENEENNDSVDYPGDNHSQTFDGENINKDQHSCPEDNQDSSTEEENIEDLQDSSPDLENSQHSNPTFEETEVANKDNRTQSLSEFEEQTDEKITSDNKEDNGDRNKENHLSDFDLEDSEMFYNQENDNFIEEHEKRVDSHEESELMQNSENEHSRGSSEQTETRKVPKLSLKLPKRNLYEDNQEDSDDSVKHSLENDQIESENEAKAPSESRELNALASEPLIQVAGPDVNTVELQLEQPLDKFDLRVLLQKCLTATTPFCIYCNHARKIAVNGKQLALHALAEHRYSAVVNSITAEELMPETFVFRIKESMDELENVFFSLESGATDEGVTFSHIFECFQCRYSTTVHKELYLHNRKMHTKNLLLCIMCKSNFYSYSELICHLCPGLYVLDYDIQFHCCMCVSDKLPSAFRLMVHLRKRHHVCDVCLELCHNQYKLSNHVWKHKLHHFCYRCGIAYRNKPDITRHLFWKHGTESVLCKKCLQKKWPHVYHFCVPPTSFLCEECNLTFSKAVSLKVHKRMHSDEKPHACTVDDCQEHFISKKLLEKHELKHREPVEEPKETPQESPEEGEVTEEVNVEETVTAEKEEEKAEEKPAEKPKPKVDVYDLPELNLSESSDSESDEEITKKSLSEENKDDSKSNLEMSEENPVADNILNLNILENVAEIDTALSDSTTKTDVLENQTEKNDDFTFEPSEKVVPVLENIWDDFKNYQAEKEKIDHLFTDKDKSEEKMEESTEHVELLTADVALIDHDYCVVDEPKVDTSITEVKPDLSQRVDHDYCSPKSQKAASPTKIDAEKTGEEETVKSPRKRSDSTSSTSSSGSSSSSCTCGSNCSCSSSSGSSSSSSDSSESDSSTEEGRKKQQLKREKRRERAKNKKAESQTNETTVQPVAVSQPVIPVPVEMPIQESDLETTESDTDEEFYDRQPQKLAKRILEEKRNQFLAEMGPVPNDTWLDTSRPTTPSLLEEEKPKKKSKSKKKKKRRSERKQENQIATTSSTIIPPSSSFFPQFYQQPPAVAPITLTIPRNSPVPSQMSSVSQPAYQKHNDPVAHSRNDDTSLRASKRRRVPNKFYGYSSDEDMEKGHVPKWRKMEPQPTSHSPLTVPPITIKTAQITQPTVEPLTIRPATQTGELRVLPKPPPPVRAPPQKVHVPPVAPPYQHHEFPQPVPHQPFQRNIDDSGSDSNDSSSEENHKPPEDKPQVQPQLYCYCRCPYDEVSEMIGCDSSDCAIEWFHFECVGIMVPPKGQWFCPDCRKKKQQKRNELTQS